MAKSRKKAPYELSPDELRWKCDPSIFDFDSTVDLEPIEGILGQERALKALKLGVDLRSPGYNIFIAGLSGTGKASTVQKILKEISNNCPPLKDYAYVNNFTDPDRPILLTFSSGRAKEFKAELEKTIELLKKRIPQVLDNETFSNRKKKVLKQYNEREQELLGAFNEKLKEDNFTLGQIKGQDAMRPEIFPLIENEAVPIQQLDDKIQENKITKDEAKEIVKNYNDHQQELQILFKKGLKLNREFQDKIFKMEKDAAENVVKGILEDFRDNFKADEKIDEYLNQIQNHILENVQIFKGARPEGDVTETGFQIDYFKEYEVNIIHDSSNSDKCPVIIETSPNHVNLFGTIEKINDGRGGFYTDFTKIKAGSLLRANSGYLVLNVNHIFEEPGVWRTLKRILTYRKLEIQDTPYTFFSPSTLKPEPIEIETKVILLGSQHIYSLLANHEYDFKKIFKIKADFDYEITNSEHVLINYARVIKKLIKEENLCEFDKSAIAYLLEVAARFAGQKNKLTTRFSKIADLAREASFWAKNENCSLVTSAHTQKAYNEALYRHGLLESKITNMIDEETLLIDVDGERIGQINGLAIYGADFYSFGRPIRITATVSLGSGGIINVEREAGMSGKHYNKGVLIISGYFRETFGQDLPLSFTANLVFEQSYGTVDGDSASCTEIFALLSTLADLPIKQSIAVTGSLNQKGDVQPIGGVNEKIEGFYDVCKLKGITGEQGVIIPIQNVKELMLRQDVVEAVKEGKFHIYPIKRVEEGIEILTGNKAGKKEKDGYEKDSVFDLVERKIKSLYEKSKQLRQPVKKKPVRIIKKQKDE